VGWIVSIEKGVLYVVATPIGNRGDISLRAVEVLRGVDLIAAEDTRHSAPLLRHMGVDTPLRAMHEHNERQLVGQILERLQGGEAVALISDAGTPLISDPGFPLIRECQQRGLRVVPVPGASAVVCALSVAGLPTNRFLFEGFPARTRAARRDQFQRLAGRTATLIFYESSHRVQDSLADMALVFGGERTAVLARELTKLHETVIHSNLAELCDRLAREPDQRKGEFVILLAGASPDPEAISTESERVLRVLSEELPVKQAASLAARLTGEKRNRLYKLALEWRRD